MRNFIYISLCFLALAQLKTTAQPTQTPVENETVEVVQGPLAASYEYQIYCLTAIFTNTSLNAIGFIWAFGNGDTIATQHPTYVYDEPGEYAVALTAINTNGGLVTFIDTITVDFCSAIPNLEATQNAVTPYPNPASNYLHFSIPTTHHTHTLVVYDSKGDRLFEKKNLHTSETIDVSSWKTGMYIYAILDKKMKLISSNKLLIKN
ncbi:MAG: T9SS type A sorting domain-containing protein [Chitinophagales bacterium]